MYPTIAIVAFLSWTHPSFPLQTKTLQTQLEMALQEKVLTLRVLSKDSHVRFDANGQPKFRGDTVSWTLYSQFEVKKVEMRNSQLQLSGPRVVLHFDRKTKRLVPSRSDRNLQVDIDFSSTATADDIFATIAKVIVGPEGLSQHVPDSWHSFLERGPEPRPASSGVVDLRILDLEGYLNSMEKRTPPPKPANSNYETPRIILRVRPRYPEEAKQFLLEGTVFLEAEITETGDVENISILLPAGAVFDENAVEAVRQWKYEPLIADGKAVRFLTTITVNYAFQR